MLLARHGIPAAASPGVLRSEETSRPVGGGGGRPRRARTLRWFASGRDEEGGVPRATTGGMEGGMAKGGMEKGSVTQRRGRSGSPQNGTTLAPATDSRSRAKRARTRAWSEKRMARESVA